MFGTPVPATDFLPMKSNSMEVDPGWFSPQVMMGQRDLQVFNLTGEEKFTGAVAGPLFPSNGIPLLAAAIGTDAVTGTGTPYTHTITQANTLSSLTVEKNIGDFQSLQFAGCRVGKYSLKTAAGNSDAEITVDITGTTAAILTTPTPISVTNEAPFTFANSTLTLLGDVRAEVTSLQLDIDNGLKETYTFGQHGPQFVTPVTVKCSGTVDLVFDSLNDATYGDYIKMSTQSLGALEVVLSQSANASVTISLAQIVLTKYSNDLKISDVIMSALSYEASRPLAGTGTVSAVVVNSAATAY